MFLAASFLISAKSPAKPMSTTRIGLCEVTFYLPGVLSLKEKRSILKPMLTRMTKQFNVSAAEVDHLDELQTSMIAITTVSNSHRHSHKVLQMVVKWIEKHHPDAVIMDYSTEMI